MSGIAFLIVIIALCVSLYLPKTNPEVLAIIGSVAWSSRSFILCNAGATASGRPLSQRSNFCRPDRN